MNRLNFFKKWTLPQWRLPQWTLPMFLLAMLMTFTGRAQDAGEVSGIVVDSVGNVSLPGVSVVIKGTSKGVSTDADGKYRIQAGAGDVLTFSFIGYEKSEVPVGSKSVINVTLRQNNTVLDELVVVGYGAVKKSSVTAAVSKVENTVLDQIPVGRPESVLAGRLAGVNVSQTNTSPGSAPLIRIRGASSIDAGNDPLVVIDGFPGGSLGSISTNDIESIEVLKDASAAAIYGSRGAGGVIIVTTKKGKSGKAKFNFNAYAGVASPKKHGDWLVGQDYYDYAVRYQNREYSWIGGDPTLPVWNDPRRPNAYQVSDVLKNGNNVVWEDEVLGSATVQNYNLSVGGGTDHVRYYVSGTLKDEQGALKNTWYKNYGVRANVDVTVNSVVSLGFMLNPSYSKRRFASTDINNYIKFPSFVAVQNPDGTYPNSRSYWGAVVSGQANPMATLEGSHYYGTTVNNLGEAFLNLNLAKGLSLRSSISTNLASNQTDRFQASWAQSTNLNSGSLAQSNSYSIANENVLSYNTTFKEVHTLSAIAGASYQKFNSNNSNMAAVNGSFNNDIVRTLNNAIINPSATNSTRSQWGLISYFSRVNYGFKDKYLLSASIRTDGSSRFGPDNKWGYFPSASVAWRVSQEEFMKSVSAVSELKLRASYGATGNFNIGDFEYLGQIGDVYYAPNNTLTKGQTQVSYGNNSLSWEKTSSYDVGLELGLFRNRISVVLDYYDKKTNGLLYNVSIPSITGFTSSLSNVGTVRNKGFEVELTTKNLVGAFKWETSFNMAKNVNTVEDLGGVQERITTDTYGMGWILRLGQPMFSYYGYKIAGVLQSQEEVNNSPVLSGSKPGNPRYQDVDGDGKITSADKVILGNFQPKAYFGLINNFAWKSFDLSIAMQASVGAKIYNFENEYYEGALLGAMRRPLVERQWWSQSETGDGMTPGSSLSQLTYQSSSDAYIEDASFLAVRNINLGYTLPLDLVQKAHLSNFRIYASLANPFMFTKKEFHGYNPEGYTGGEIAGTGSKPGFNNGAAPINRVYTLGINFNF
ncbi:TonB-dependent receptor P26 [Dyadobacter sp. CECT 9623]|uniref:TonB-dependent receptor P26 n=1 Tax=Dyadobacter linearis TaxID=2823330 RepID=A0ABM8UKP1_9BACT|nr:TonB-dependent receptor [Dyadobacter sp. CECT 9623]CAG5068056.1 TonB-dependent receptor P26 [Dyadobacter sp. CECT 9623]